MRYIITLNTFNYRLESKVVRSEDRETFYIIEFSESDRFIDDLTRWDWITRQGTSCYALKKSQYSPKQSATIANCVVVSLSILRLLHQKFLTNELSPSTTCDSNQFSSMRDIHVIHADQFEIVKSIRIRDLYTRAPQVPHIGDIAAVRGGQTRSEFNGAMFITVYVVTHGSDSVNGVIKTISSLMRSTWPVRKFLQLLINRKI